MATITSQYNAFAPVIAVRKARRAYVGLLGFAFERAANRIDILRAKRDDLMVELVARGESLQTNAFTLAKDAKAKTSDFVETGFETVSKITTDFGSNSREAALEAEVAALTKKLAKLKKDAVKPAKTAVKKAVKAAPKAKPVAASKAKAPKTDVMPKVIVKKDTIEVAPTATVTEKAEAADKYAPYFEKVSAYDADADAAYVRKIVNHLGIALSTRDGQLVACSDAAERDVVRDSWLVKHLGVKGETDALDAKVLSVCDAMKADRMKDRVVFYYLLAKQEGRLAAI